MEIFIQAKQKFITREHLLRKLQELFCLLEVRVKLFKLLRQRLLLFSC